MENIVANIRRQLKGLADPKVGKSEERFFKEKIKTYGVKTPVVRRLASKYFQKIKHLDKIEIFKLSEELYNSGYNQEATIATQWIGKLKEQFSLSDFTIFESWLGKYIDNWAKVDDYCLHVIHPMIDKYPSLVKKVRSWAYSENRWLRRASAVSFITTVGQFYGTKHGLKDIFDVADILLVDEDDMVQKGYGWMLKAASVRNQKEVFEYVMKNKDKMPRTALRYAIEKMPKKFKKIAMQQNNRMPGSKSKLEAELEELLKSKFSGDTTALKFLERLKKGKLTIEENPKSHFCVYFAAYDPKAKEIFFGHHKKSGLWLFNGGHIDKGETIKETLQREINEEWGMKLKNLKISKRPELLTITEIYNPKKQPCRAHYDLWHFVLVNKKFFKPDKKRLAKEFYENRWVKLEDARKLIAGDINHNKAIDFFEANLF